MIFNSKATPAWRRAVAGLAVAAAAATLAACGGGTSQYETFVPKRLFAFGDETSLVTPSGRKYSVNGINADTNALDCRSNPLWVQSVATAFGFTFAECNPLSVFEPQARSYASLEAKVADVTAQVEAQVASGGYRDGDLALVLVGTHDILELYGQYPARPEATLLNDARQRGEALARVVNRLVGLGVKVIVSNLPDLGVSPYGLAQKAANTDTDRAALLSRLTGAFNDQLGVNVILDGRYVGLMQSDLRTQGASRSPPSFGLVNASEAVCTVALPDCSNLTLLPNANASQYLWADATRLAPGGHSILAGLALDRARNNPF